MIRRALLLVKPDMFSHFGGGRKAPSKWPESEDCPRVRIPSQTNLRDSSDHGWEQKSSWLDKVPHI